MKNDRKFSPQALRICAMTLLCLLLMFGIAAAKKNQVQAKMSQEYAAEQSTAQSGSANP